MNVKVEATKDAVTDDGAGQTTQDASTVVDVTQTPATAPTADSGGPVSQSLQELSETIVKNIVEAAGRRVTSIMESAGKDVENLLQLSVASVSQSTASIVADTANQMQAESKARVLQLTPAQHVITVVDRRSGESTQVKLPQTDPGEKITGYKITIG